MRHDAIHTDDATEFRVIPAPPKGERAPGLKTDEARMANTLTGILNEMAAEGWEYVRADTLPNQVSADPSGTAPKTMTLLVFRREVAPVMPAAAPSASPFQTLDRVDAVEPTQPITPVAPPPDTLQQAQSTRSSQPLVLTQPQFSA